MYMIEQHSRHHAHTLIVLEKGDDIKPYEQFASYRLITNHTGDTDEKSCQFCASHRRAALLRDRKANAI